VGKEKKKKYGHKEVKDGENKEKKGGWGGRGIIFGLFPRVNLLGNTGCRFGGIKSEWKKRYL